MAQADVINITKRSDRHPDDMVLRFASKWKLARAEARLVWAKYDHASSFCTKENEYDPGSAEPALQAYADAEFHLAQMEPKTTLGASVLLQAVADIVATQKLDPELNFADGPVLEIVLNVARALSKKEIRLDK